MQTQLLVLLLLPSAVRPASRIVGGAVAAIADHPYQLSLRLHGVHVCGAAILSEKIAVTAAHCLKVPGPYSIKAGSGHLQDGGVVAHVEQAIVHPHFDRATNDFDICLLFLATGLVYSDKIKPVKLPKEGELVREGMVGQVAGWGTVSTAADYHSEDLRAVELPVWNDLRCRRAYLYGITERMFCAGLPNGGKDSCKGDSGGAFVVHGTLYGIVSFGLDCAQPGFPGIYANVPVLRSFIREYAGF
ncbi:Trypsin domain containing protein [Asbolus verrucosus]|uniref:Trypsin domain containing protein n=1 Tax=Asbolus verrucosus TaxID=1661398 RepID=A0A482W0P0_ASBVE|nr:Trypsin domain containing protein [Asbolus verrucosus]